MTTADRVQLGVRIWEPEGPSSTSVVLVHGFGASKDDETVTAVAGELCAAGHHVITYTARGHGESEGLCTLGDREHFDVEAAVALARTRASRTVLVGTSMGAIAVLRYAAADAVDGVVTVSSPAEWRVPRTVQSAGAAALTQTSVGRWAARRFFGVRLQAGWSGAAPPVELVASISAPVAVIHGTGDRFIKAAEAVKLHDASVGPRQLHLVPEMGHAYMPESIGPIIDAVSWALASSGADSRPTTSSN